MRRFRVKTTKKLNDPSRHRYFSTPSGATHEVLKMLDQSNTYMVEVFDNTRTQHYGWLGKLGGLTTKREHVTRIAQVLYSPEIARKFGVDPRE